MQQFTSPERGRDGNMVMFEQLGRLLIKENVYLVISLKNDGNLSIAQQVEIMAGGKPMHMFLKNAIEIKPDKLYDLQALISSVIQKLFDIQESLQ